MLQNAALEVNIRDGLIDCCTNSLHLITVSCIFEDEGNTGYTKPLRVASGVYRNMESIALSSSAQIRASAVKDVSSVRRKST